MDRALEVAQRDAQKAGSLPFVDDLWQSVPRISCERRGRTRGARRRRCRQGPSSCAHCTSPGGARPTPGRRQHCRSSADFVLQHFRTCSSPAPCGPLRPAGSEDQKVLGANCAHDNPHGCLFPIDRSSRGKYTRSASQTMALLLFLARHLKSSSAADNSIGSRNDCVALGGLVPLGRPRWAISRIAILLETVVFCGAAPRGALPAWPVGN